MRVSAGVAEGGVGRRGAAKRRRRWRRRRESASRAYHDEVIHGILRDLPRSHLDPRKLRAWRTARAFAFSSARWECGGSRSRRWTMAPRR